VHLLRSVTQPYAWGSTTALTELLGIEATGGPMAELWMGDHPALPTPLAEPTEGCDDLAQLIDSDPTRFLGAELVARFGPRLPFLFKVMAIDAPLSIQAHPSLPQAQAGYARENAEGVALDAPTRVYRDANHKPELICALTEMEALCGFRTVDDACAVLDTIGTPVTTRMAESIRSLATDATGAGWREILRRCLTGDYFTGDPSDDTEEIARAAAGHDQGTKHEPTGWARTATTIAEIARRHPGDGGVLVALVLQHRVLAPGDALFLEAGNVHAYLRGVGVEIMANSDNVLRGGLTPKHIDVDELCAIVSGDRQGSPPEVLRAEVLQADAPHVVGWSTPVPDFSLRRIDLVGDRNVAVPAGPAIVLCTEGAAALTSANATLEIARGRSAFVAFDESVRASGSGTLFVATTNDSSH
jgi:mannose-6-phosphate isomerase